MNETIRYTTYEAGLLPALVEFWNRLFADRRNFFAVTETILRERIFEKKTAVERFHPEGMILALEGARIVGVIHGGRFSESISKVIQPDWPGGEIGYIALIAVDPDYRRRGIGTSLWHRIQQHLQGVARVIVDGQCLNPFYGNSQGPLTPLWGTPEGISVAWNDGETKKFLAKRGHVPRFKAVQLSLEVATAALHDTRNLEAELTARGFLCQSFPGVYPELGRPSSQPRSLPEGLLFECLAALEGGRTAGMICVYPMLNLAFDRHAIYEMAVHPDYQGRGIARPLLGLMIERVRAQVGRLIDVLTIPEVSPVAFELYQSMGFKPCAEWAVY